MKKSILALIVALPLFSFSLPVFADCWSCDATYTTGYPTAYYANDIYYGSSYYMPEYYGYDPYYGSSYEYYNGYSYGPEAFIAVPFVGIGVGFGF